MLISGSKKYIKEVNEIVDKYFSKYRNNKKYITVINCFEVEEFDDDIRDILYEHEYIINKYGINIFYATELISNINYRLTSSFEVIGTPS